MLYLVTATPGSGKTLYVLSHFSKFAQKDNRQVYYSGITLSEEGKAATGWIELEEPRDWYKQPEGSVIVIDECQRVFPKRTNGAAVPPYVEEFETHRHHGFDVILITQHPGLIDAHVRKLVGRHIFLQRIMGTPSCQVLQWDVVQEKPDSKGAKDNCIDTGKFLYPREVYKWYESAVMHTHKVRIPSKVYLLIALIIFVIFMIYRSFNSADNLVEKDSSRDTTQTATATSGTVSAGHSDDGAEKKPMTPKEWAEQRKPRLINKPESAPVYDDLAKAKTFPRLSACVQMGDTCQCYSQQGSKIIVATTQCEKYVKEGWFDPYLEENRDRRVLAEREVPPETYRGQSRTTVSQGGKRTYIVGERQERKQES